MQLKFFQIPIYGGPAENELNAFLRSHRILTTQRALSTEGQVSAWAVCVEYLDAAPAPEKASFGKTGAKSKVDYKEVLSAEDFARYSSLREVRKTMAEREGVPIYAVFTNEQLAQMVIRNVTTVSQLSQIDRISADQARKFGPDILSALIKQPDSTKNGTGATQTDVQP